jgi:acyl-CoA synthetase (AMP-forming)/AMP-acid ligase II
MDCPGVAQVAILTIKDPIGKPLLLAAVVKKLGVDLTASELQAFCKEHLPEGERPKSFAFMPEFPTDNHGMVNKYRMRFDFGAT